MAQEFDYFRIIIRQQTPGSPLGIRIADKHKEGMTNVAITYVEPKSLLDGQAKAEDCIISVNAVHVTDSRMCARLLKEGGPDLTIIMARSKTAPSAAVPQYVYTPPKNIPPATPPEPVPEGFHKVHQATTTPVVTAAPTTPVVPAATPVVSATTPVVPKVPQQKATGSREEFVFSHVGGGPPEEQYAWDAQRTPSPPKSGPPPDVPQKAPDVPQKAPDVPQKAPDVPPQRAPTLPEKPPEPPKPAAAPKVTEPPKVSQPPVAPQPPKVETVSSPNLKEESQLPEEIRKKLEEGRALAEKERKDQPRSIIKAPRSKSKKKKGVSMRGDSDLHEISISDSIDPRKQLRKVPKR